MKIKTFPVLGALIAMAPFFPGIKKGGKSISSAEVKGRYVNDTFLKKKSDTTPVGILFYSSERLSQIVIDKVNDPDLLAETPLPGSDLF